MDITDTVSSLEHLSLVKATISLWNSEKALKLIIKYREKWNKVVEKIQRETASLPDVSSPTKIKRLCLVQVIGLQVKKWFTAWVWEPGSMPILAKNQVRSYFFNIVWTPAGTIDMLKTAEQVVQDESIDVVCRYRVAGFYCIEEHVERLFPKVDKSSNFIEPMWKSRSDKVLSAFWSYFKEGNAGEPFGGGHWEAPDDNYCMAVYQASCHGNETATKYFWDKLNSEERDKSMYDILMPYSIFSALTREERLDLFLEKYRYGQLDRLLDWPNQDAFLQVVGQLWKSMPFQIFCELVDKMLEIIRGNPFDYIWTDILMSFWYQASIRLQVAYLVTKLCYDIHVMNGVRDFLEQAKSFKNKMEFNAEVSIPIEAVQEPEDKWTFEKLLGHCVRLKEPITIDKKEYKEYKKKFEKLKLLIFLIGFYLHVGGHPDLLAKAVTKYFFTRPNFCVCYGGEDIFNERVIELDFCDTSATEQD